MTPITSFTVHSLVHVESEADVLFFGEQKNEKMVAGLTLFNGWVQTDLKEKGGCRSHIRQSDTQPN